MDSTWYSPWAEDVSSLPPNRDGPWKFRALEKMAGFFRLALGSVEKGGG